MQLIDESREKGHDFDEGEISVDLQAFLDSKFLRTTTLPLGMLGSGNCDLAAKHEGLFHCLKLNCGIGTDA